MATNPSTAEARDANLRTLKTAVDEWAENEQRRMDKEVLILRAVLQGRGISEAGTGNLVATSALVQAEIDEFITGSTS